LSNEPTGSESAGYRAGLDLVTNGKILNPLASKSRQSIPQPVSHNLTISQTLFSSTQHIKKNRFSVGDNLQTEKFSNVLYDLNLNLLVTSFIFCKKGKAVPLKAWNGQEGSRKLRLPDFVTAAQDGGKVVSFTHRPHLPP
jgi:hypothetical protein